MAIADLPDALLALVVAFADDDCSALKGASLACSRRTQSDEMWSCACAHRFERTYDLSYFVSNRVGYKTIAAWESKEGWYTLFNMHPFGLLVKLQLVSEQRMVGLAVGRDFSVLPVATEELFNIDIGPSGHHHFHAGAVHRLASLRELDHQESENLLGQSSLRTGSLLSPSLNHAFASSSALLGSTPLVHLCFDEGTETTEYPIGSWSDTVLLYTTRLPVSSTADNCFCGGPFASMYLPVCGCNHGLRASVDAILSQESSSSQFSSNKPASDDFILALVKCSSFGLSLDVRCKHLPFAWLNNGLYYIDNGESFGKYRYQTVDISFIDFSFEAHQEVRVVVRFMMRKLFLQKDSMSSNDLQREVMLSEDACLFDFLLSVVTKAAVTMANGTRKFFRLAVGVAVTGSSTFHALGKVAFLSSSASSSIVRTVLEWPDQQSSSNEWETCDLNSDPVGQIRVATAKRKVVYTPLEVPEPSTRARHCSFASEFGDADGGQADVGAVSESTSPGTSGVVLYDV